MSNSSRYRKTKMTQNPRYQNTQDIKKNSRYKKKQDIKKHKQEKYIKQLKIPKNLKIPKTQMCQPKKNNSKYRTHNISKN